MCDSVGSQGLMTGDPWTPSSSVVFGCKGCGGCIEPFWCIGLFGLIGHFGLFVHFGLIGCIG